MVCCGLTPHLELASRPDLYGSPVVVGRWDGHVIAASDEALAAGVAPGMPLRQAEHLCPLATFLMPDQEAAGIEPEPRVDHHRVRELVGRAGEQVERERQLAARPAADQQAEAPFGQTADAGEAVERRPAQPGRRRRKLRRTRERLASEADPNRFDRIVKTWLDLGLHSFPLVCLRGRDA